MNALGKGVYTISEAAQYLGAAAPTLHRWFGGGGMFFSDYGVVDGIKYLSFLDLMDVMVAVQLRQNNVKMSELRTAYKNLEQDIGPHPFARKTVFHHDGKVFRKHLSKDQTPALYRVATGEGYIEEVMADYLRAVEFNHKDIAERWHIAKGIVIDPAVQFGHPVIQGTRIFPATLARSYEAEGSIETVAVLYRVKPEQVEAAIYFSKAYPKAA